MVQLTKAENAIERFKENENRVDIFVNQNGSYLTNEASPREVQTLPYFMQSLLERFYTLNFKGDWITEQAYEINDIVETGGIVYLCLENHTSGVFLTDMNSGKWGIFQNTLEKNSVVFYGADPTGLADSTAVLQSAIDKGGILQLPKGTFKYSYLEFNEPIAIVGEGVLLYDGSVPVSGTASIQINAPMLAENFKVRSTGVAENAFDLIQASASNIKIGFLELKSDVQRNQTGGANFYGENIFIDKVVSENVARPIAFQPPTLANEIRKNVHVGDVFAKNYIRGFAASYLQEWSLQSLNLKERWSGVVTMTPGYNGILLQDCVGFKIGDCFICDASEHSFRIGGSGDSSNFEIGNVTSVNSRGCAVKFNVNVGALCENGSVGRIVGINTGEGMPGGNREVTRLTRIKNITIDSISGYEFVSSTLVLQDVEKLTVGTVYGENVRARIVQFKTDYDSSSGNINGVFIENAFGYMAAGIARAAYGIDYADGDRTIGNVFIENSFVTGFTHYLCTSNSANIYSGPVVIKAQSLSTDPNGCVENVANDELFFVDWHKGSARYSGRAYGASLTAQNAIQSGQFANLTSVTSEQKGALFFRSVATPSKNAYGAGVAFSRLNSDRRGFAIVAKQTGDLEQNMGIAFLCGHGSIATDELFEQMILKHNGAIYMNLPTYANNSAALTGGLVVGDAYKTATGEIRIVV